MFRINLVNKKLYQASINGIKLKLQELQKNAFKT